MTAIVETLGATKTSRNPGMALDVDWVRSVRVNRSAA